MIPNFNWNATAFFQQLTEQNKLAKEKGFRFCRVTGLQGFEEALGSLQSAKAIVAIDDAQYRDRLVSLLRAKWAVVQDREPRAAWAAMMRYAASRGFEASLASDCIKQVTHIDDQDD